MINDKNESWRLTYKYAEVIVTGLELDYSPCSCPYACLLTLMKSFRLRNLSVHSTCYAHVILSFNESQFTSLDVTIYKLTARYTLAQLIYPKLYVTTQVYDPISKEENEWCN